MLKANRGFRIVLALALFGLAAVPTLSRAQAFPNKPIRIIVPIPAGVGPEVEMRQIAARLSTLLGQGVIVENRPGAAGRIATDAVIKSPADGYTLLLTTPSTAILEYVSAVPPYDSRRELTPVSLVSSTAFALYVSGDSPIQNLAQYIQAAKAKPDSITMGTFGIGGTHHMVSAWLSDVAGIQLRYIHYQTSPPYNDAARGEINSVFESVLPVLGLVKSGKLRAIGVSGKTRHAQLPDTPTYAEAGLPQFNPIVWSALSAPAKTPPAVVDRLSAAIAEVVRSPDFVKLSQERSRDAIGSTPAEFGAFFEQEHARWSAIAKKAGVRIE
jgi:tripartite-type tricarboxylate transporter receptor subunit TctC